MDDLTKPKKEIPTNKIIQGDSLSILKHLPNESVSCVMTSPPYWALRDYGIDVETIWDAKERCEHEWKTEITKRPNQSGGKGNLQDENEGSFIVDYNKRETKSDFCLKCRAWNGQLGLEPTFDLYIKHLCDIFDEAKRVLRKDGTCWVNLGDTYYSISGGKFLNDNIGRNNCESGLSQANQLKAGNELEQKNLCLIPFRFAIEMQNRGWILRNTIIWHKPNCMPSSIKDRFTVDFEYLFFFVKNKKYWFETQYEPMKKETFERYNYGWAGNEDRNYIAGPQNHMSKYVGSEKLKLDLSLGRNKRAVWNIKDRITPYAIIEPEFRKEIIDFRNLPEHNAIREYLTKWRNAKGITIEQLETYFENQAGHHWFEKDGSYPSKDDWLKLKELLGFDDTFDEAMITIFQKSGLKQNSPEGRIMRTVWTICPRPFKEAHFATYPEELCFTPIKASCPEFICKKCGKAREKILEPTEEYAKHLGQSWHDHSDDKGMGFGQQTRGFSSRKGNVSDIQRYNEKGFTTCSCNAGFESGIVLDPFFGAGTTGLVALKQNKRFVGIELQPKYIEIAMKRLKPYLEQTKLEIKDE